MSDEAPCTERQRSARRSPNFPYIDLPTAIARVSALYTHERRNAAPWDVVAGHWEYSPTSSSMDKVVGALRAFGLVDVEGSGSNRTIRLSARALDIVEDEREESPERDQAIRDAALAPPIHRQIRETYGADLPSEGTLRTWLVRSLDFNPNATESVIATYRASIQYARLDRVAESGKNGGGVPQDTGDSKPSSPAPPPPPPASAGKIGSLPVPEGSKQEMAALDSGQAIVQWPATISEADYQDIIDWLEILKRKIKRSVQAEKTPE